MYKKYTPPTGDITPDTLPGFRHKRNEETLKLINVEASDVPQIRNIPVKFGTDNFIEYNSPSQENSLYNSISDEVYHIHHFQWIIY